MAQVQIDSGRWRRFGRWIGGLSGDAVAASGELTALKARLDARLAGGAQLAMVELDNGDHPWLAGAGMFHKDALFDAWQQAIEASRRKTDEAPDAP